MSFGFVSSGVDPIFSFWILIKSSWSNIFCTGFESNRVDPIFLFWIFLKWRDIFSCTRIRYFFVGSSPAALWRPCASLISALTKLNLAPRTNTSLSLPTLLNIKEKKIKTTVSEPADDQRHFPTCRKKTSKIHDSYVRKMILSSFFIIFSGLFDEILNIRIDLGGGSKNLCFFSIFHQKSCCNFFNL